MPPLFSELPEVLETERLILRIPLPGDGAAVNEAVRDSWPELQQWMLWARGEMPPVEETEEIQIRNREAFLERSGFHYSLFLRNGNRFAGKCSLFDLNWEVPKATIGYWLRSDLTGQGLMTEAVRAVETFAFGTLGMVRLQIDCDPRNLKSAAIAERLGYTKEGHLRCHSRSPQGDLRDTLIFAKIRRQDANQANVSS